MAELTDVHLQSFQNRLKISDAFTKLLVTYLKLKDHFQPLRKASYEEEMQGIDWWVTYPNETEASPIQFKLRDKRFDVPVVRFQPFLGHGHVRSEEGRDYRGIVQKASRFYYVGIRNSSGLFSTVYRCPSAVLNEEVTALDREWKAAVSEPTARPRERGGSYGFDYFSIENVRNWLDHGVGNKLVFTSSTGSQIWWKKNPNEGTPKLNMYIPHRLRDWTQSISDSEGKQIKRLVGRITSDSGSLE
jgi:hypothetical protein